MKQNLSKNKTMKIVEEKLNKNIEEILRVKFVDEDKPAKEIADELQISYATVIRWLNLAGIYSHRLNL